MEEKKKETKASKTKNSTKQEVKASKSSAAKSSTKASKPSSKVSSSKQKEAPAPQKREIDFSAAPRVKRARINLSENFNDSGIFDVYLYRELFMELRKQMDELYAKRNRGTKESNEYDDAVYNVTSNAISDPGAQDFLGFCYKKGFYDFCVMNYEKYMKWTILAAANGNAFSISKLQVFLTTAIDHIMQVEDQKVIVDFLDISGDNYMMLLSKMVCENIVKIMNITSEQLIKLPEKFLEQNEEIQKEFDNAKMKAAEIVKEEIQKSVTELNNAVKQEIEQENINSKIIQEKTIGETEPAPKNLEETSENQVEEQEQKEEPSESKFKRNLKIRKKFRY